MLERHFCEANQQRRGNSSRSMAERTTGQGLVSTVPLAVKEVEGGHRVKDAIVQEAESLSVALVGESDKRDRVVNIFKVLEDLKLAKLASRDDGDGKDTGSAGAAAAAASKDKHHEKIKPVNLVKDKNSGKRYIVDPLPSVIISITGDAQDMPDDHEFLECVEKLIGGGELELNREAASRAISMMTACSRAGIKKAVDTLRSKYQGAGDTEAKLSVVNMKPNEEVIPADLKEVISKLKEVTTNYKEVITAKLKALEAGSSVCMQVLLLLQVRMLELEAIKDVTLVESKKTLSYAFQNIASVRDVMLDVSNDTKEQFESLKKYQFKITDDDLAKPVISSKRLSKSRYISLLHLRVRLCACGVAHL